MIATNSTEAVEQKWRPHQPTNQNGWNRLQ